MLARRRFALDQIASKVLDHVHRTVSAEWAELAASVHASLGEDDDMSEELAYVLKGKEALESLVTLRTSYILNVLDSPLLGPKVGHLRNAVQAMKASCLVANTLAASDAALPLDRDAWKAPWMACLSSLARISPHGDDDMLEVIRANFLRTMMSRTRTRAFRMEVLKHGSNLGLPHPRRLTALAALWKLA